MSINISSSFINPSYRDHPNAYIQATEDFLSGDGTEDDFQGMCVMILKELGTERNLPVDLEFEEDYDNKFIDECRIIYVSNYLRIQSLINRHSVLILEEEFNEENDAEFRSIGPKIDKIVSDVSREIYILCHLTLSRSIMSTPSIF